MASRPVYRDLTDATKEAARFANIWRLYRLTRDDYYAMIERQGGRCGVCQEPLNEGLVHGIHVDHCHSTNKVRGMLCGDCNTQLGKIEKRLDSFKGFWEYLENSPRIPIPDYIPKPSGRPTITRTPEEKRELARDRKAKQRAAKKAVA